MTLRTAKRVPRAHWQVVCQSGEVAPGQALLVTVQGRPFVVFRLTSGVVGLVGAMCPHLFAPLSLYAISAKSHRALFGRIDASGLRCLHHGWKFDPSGRCIERPDSFEGDRVPVAEAYATMETAGRIWCDVTSLSAAVPAF